MRVAAVQMTSTADKARNLEVAVKLIRAATADGAELVVLPETFNVLGDADALRAGAEPIDGPTLAWARGLSRERGIWLVAGSICERVAGQERYYNTSCLVDPHGEVRAIYRKIHLFDCDVAGAAYRESSDTLAGQEVVVAEAGDTRVGMTICYDLRFPELYRILTLRGAGVIVVPSAFMERTGRDHWEILLRARAIENQVFVVAADQVGATPARMQRFGRSMIVDPWGIVLAQAPDRECHIVANLDRAVQDAVRAQLPSLRNRRPEAYRWPG